MPLKVPNPVPDNDSAFYLLFPAISLAYLGVTGVTQGIEYHTLIAQNLVSEGKLTAEGAEVLQKFANVITGQKDAEFYVSSGWVDTT